jgi:hypothetical protein
LIHFEPISSRKRGVRGEEKRRNKKDKKNHKLKRKKKP